MSGQSGGRLKLAKLNEQLTCKLCKGYFIDATTIIECLHSFCRSCIVKYLETNKYCPICEVQVHKSKPLLNIRPDHTLQDIVYKIVPGCYQNEMRCRREFYEKHPEAQLSSMSPEARGEPIESHIYSLDESLSLSLEYYNPTLNDSPICSETDDEKSSSSSSKLQPRRYLRCPAAVTVFHLQKLIRAKYGLSDAHRVDIMYKEEPLYGNYTLMDVMYIYHWRRKVPLHLSYRIFESSPKRMKLSEDNKHFKQSLSNAGITPLNPSVDDQNNGKREWKEVQLKISETGVMSVTGITSPETKKSQKKETLEDEQRRLDESVAVVKTKTEKFENTKKKSTEESKVEVKPDNSSLLVEKPKKPTEMEVDHSEDNNNKSPGTSNIPKTTNNSNPIPVESSRSSEPREKMKTVTEIPKIAEKLQNSQVSGSKIESLSAKLQFQPKVGQVNNTYSKKSQKEKKSFLEKVLKKPEPNKQEAKEKSKSNSATANSSSLSVSSGSKQVNLPSGSSSKSGVSSVASSTGSTVNLNALGGCTYSTAPSLSISLTTKRSSSPERSKSSENKADDETIRQKPPHQQQNSLPPVSSESSSSGGLNLPIIGLGQSSSSFPYLVQNLVDSGVLKSPTKTTSGPKNSQTSIQSQFNIQTPSMSIYSIPTTSKNQNTSSSNSTSSSSSHSITTTATNSSSSNLKSSNSSSKSSLEITQYSVPPCPDAIPISLMKPTVRKTDNIAKGTNLNEICAKIGNSGSKINDICAKIGENSKERDKNKNERTRPEIPDLLKITKKPTIISETTIGKHGQTIPNVPSYTPSNSLSLVVSESKGSSSSSSSSGSGSSSKPPTTPTSSSMLTSQSLMMSKPSTSSGKGKSQSVGFKTLKDPPKPWNPTLSRNNYVATKNQAKELNAEANQGSCGQQGKPNQSKIKIFKTRNNVPRYLGNPASGVKPMYGASTEPVSSPASSSKEQTKDQSTSSSSLKSLSMTRVDPKTLSPIVSTTNSPIVSPPPYSPNARNYNPSFSREMARSGSSLSPRNSPVNMLSTGPFIPSPTPNTNPRLFPTFLSPFSDSRFPSSIIRSPIGISAYHSSLPPSINKFYQGRYLSSPQGTGYSQALGQPPTVQRIPPSHSSASPKSPKTSTVSVTPVPISSSVNLAKSSEASDSSDNKAETSTSRETSQEGNRAFNLTKTATPTGAAPSDLSKVSEEKKLSTSENNSTKEAERRKSEDAEGSKEKGKIDEKCDKDVKKEQSEEQSSKSEEKKETVEKEKTQENESNSLSKTLNGLKSEASGSAEPQTKEKSSEKPKETDTSDKVKNKCEDKQEEIIVSESKCEELNKEKAQEAQRNKPES